MASSTATHKKQWEMLAAFIFGCVFLLIILAITFLKPNPTPFEYTIFRIVIALATAGIGAILPGFLDVNFRTWLRAGGAVALFVVVYFFSPVAIPALDTGDGTIIEPAADAKIQANAWLRLIDEGKYDVAYDSMADSFRKRYSFDDVSDLIKRERTHLGQVKSRAFISFQATQSPPGAPRGAYRAYLYKSTFTKEPRAIFESVWLVGEKKDWRVVGFYTYIKNQAGQLISYDPDE